MSHGNASPDDARRVSYWIDQETQTRIGIRACLSDLRRERDRIAEAFEKIQQDRKKANDKRQDFESIKRSQQQHCDRLHFILDGNQEHTIIYKYTIRLPKTSNCQTIDYLVEMLNFRFVPRKNGCMGGTGTNEERRRKA